MASALDYAHRRGVLHRDVKPANVLLAADGTPKLADFNISSSNLDGVSPAAYFGGSLAYMSPEQLDACHPGRALQPEDLDGRSDLYSLAVLLWELLYGERPFRSEAVDGGWLPTLEKLSAQRRQGMPPESDDFVAERCEAQLRRVLLRCLLPEVDGRFATGEELARELLLCLQPHTQRLLHSPRHGWRLLVRRFGLAAVLGAAILPNAFAAVFNFLHNEDWLRRNVGEPLMPLFHTMAAVVNGIAFPIGILLLARYTWHVHRVARDAGGQEFEPAELAEARRRALWLGHWASVIGMIEWGIAGWVYPITLRCLGIEVGFAAYLQFVASLTLSGLIAAAYPFFLITFLGVRVFFPALLRRSPGDEHDEHELLELARRAGTYLLLAGGVPLLSVAFFVLVMRSDSSDSYVVQIALGLISVLGLSGFFLAWQMYSTIQRDIAALVSAVRPADMLGVETDTGRY